MIWICLPMSTGQLGWRIWLMRSHIRCFSRMSLCHTYLSHMRFSRLRRRLSFSRLRHVRFDWSSPYRMCGRLTPSRDRRNRCEKRRPIATAFRMGGRRKAGTTLLRRLVTHTFSRFTRSAISLGFWPSYLHMMPHKVTNKNRRKGLPRLGLNRG